MSVEGLEAARGDIELEDDVLNRMEPREQRRRMWRPRADVVESEGEFTIQVDLPGLEREDVILEAQGRELTIRGERRQEKSVGGAYLVMERVHGPFGRTFILPESTSAQSIRASMANGLLTIVVPKPAAPEPRRIQVNTGD